MARTPSNRPISKKDSPPGGKALKRLRQFELARGLKPIGNTLDMPEEKKSGKKPTKK
jgi:hypothetical protein